MGGKRLSAVFGIVVAVILFVGLPNDARGSDWVFYLKDAAGCDSYYDSQSIRVVSKSVVKVWEKKIISKEGRAAFAKSYQQAGLSTAALESLSERKLLHYINFVDETWAITHVIDMSSDGRFLINAEREQEWSNIIPDSSEQILMILVVQKVLKDLKSKE